jgi:hypothetical protein
MSEDLDETAENAISGQVTYDIAGMAKMAGVTKHAVRLALREGRIRRCNSLTEKRPKFSQQEAEFYLAAVQTGGRRPLTRRPSEQVEVAKADAVTNLVSQAQGHTEEMSRLVVGMVKEMRMSAVEMSRSKDDTISHLRKRLEALEEQIDNYNKAMAAIRESQFNKIVAEGEAEKKRQQGKAMYDLAMLVGPAVLGRLLGGAELQQSAFGRIVKSMTDEQRLRLFEAAGGILTQDQSMALMTLLADFESKESKEKAAVPEGAAASPAG